MNKYLDKAKEALKKGEFENLILGKEEYAVKPRNLPTSAPTDINSMFESGIYMLVNDDNRENIADLVKETIIKLLAKGPTEVWLAYNACWAQVYFEQKKKAPFLIADADFLKYVKQAINNKKSELQACRKYDGALYTNGLWEDMYNANNVLVRKFGVSLL